MKLLWHHWKDCIDLFALTVFFFHISVILLHDDITIYLFLSSTQIDCELLKSSGASVFNFFKKVSSPSSPATTKCFFYVVHVFLKWMTLCSDTGKKMQFVAVIVCFVETFTSWKLPESPQISLSKLLSFFRVQLCSQWWTAHLLCSRYSFNYLIGWILSLSSVYFLFFIIFLPVFCQPLIIHFWSSWSICCSIS